MGLIDERITAVRQRQEQERRARERRPPPPDWIVQHGIGKGPLMIHTKTSPTANQCWARVGAERCAPATREQALAALSEGGAERARSAVPTPPWACSGGSRKRQ
ncbi:hypothetical protein AB0M57_34280 [Streptomyces sp. NPDC051597]|uniref:hypothetical protein n=1 Tax=Streptomyces sp. NPDC051597 TaxID=3155049 RepID=UPI00344A48B4